MTTAQVIKTSVTFNNSPIKDYVHLGRVVQSWVKITQGYCKVWIQIWRIEKHFNFNSFCLEFDDREL